LDLGLAKLTGGSPPGALPPPLVGCADEDLCPTD
jgi:hypothetical protein